jgi:hypothetical protein
MKMGLRLEDLKNKSAIFKELNTKYGQMPMNRKRQWTAADLTYSRPSNEALYGFDTTKQFTVEAGKSSSTGKLDVLLVVPLEVAERGRKEKRISVGSIADK